MRPPEFWQHLDGRAAAPVTRSLLTPMSWLYDRLAQRRSAKIVPTKVSVPVICIGNITVGGTGKTPLALLVAKTLLGQGVQPAFLSRGYGGQQRSSVQVDLKLHGFADVGDEPLLLAKTAPTFVGRDRVASAKLAIAGGAQVLILDDGFQNPSLAKDLSVLVIDAGAGHGNGRIFPAGPLREPVARALNRADAVVLVGAGPQPNLAGFTGPMLRANIMARKPVPTGKLLAFAGIGRPQKFFDHIREAGADLEQEIAFADHHAYRAKDVANLFAWTTRSGIRLITTEKDILRWPEETRDQVLVWAIDMVFEHPGDLVQVLQKANIR